MSAQPSPSPGVADEASLILFYNDFRKYLNIDSAFNESHRRRLQSNRAQQKLLRLTAQQFQELSTDVYDELLRRINPNQPTYLLPRNNFHPKRNQARQKLSLLSVPRFNDLSFDILYEIERRLKDHPTKTAQDAVRNPISAFPTSPPSAPSPGSSNLRKGSLDSSLDFTNVNSNNPSNIPAAYSASSPHQRVSNMSQNTTVSREGSTQNDFFQLAPPPYDTASLSTAPSTTSATPQQNPSASLNFDSSNDDHSNPNFPFGNNGHKNPDFYSANNDHNNTNFHNTNTDSTPQYIQPTTKTITPAKSTLVEESDSDSNNDPSEHPHYPRNSNTDNQVYNDPNNHLNESYSNFNGVDSSSNFNSSQNPLELHPSTHNGDKNGNNPAHPHGNENFNMKSVTLENNNYRSLPQMTNELPNSSAFENNHQHLGEQALSNVDPTITRQLFNPSESHNSSSNIEVENSNLRQQVSDQNEQIQNLIKEGTRLDSNIGRLESQLQESEAVKETLVDENGRLHQLIVDAEVAREQLEMELSSLRTEVANQKNNTSDKDYEVQKIKNELNDTSREFGIKTEQYITDLEDKQQRIETLEQQNQKLKERCSELLEKQNNLVSSPPLPGQMPSDATLAQHKKTIASLREELEAKNTELLSKHQIIGSRDIQLTEKDQHIADLLTQLSQSHHSNGTSDKAVQEAVDKVTQEAAIEKGEIIHTMQQFEQEVIRLKQELADLQNIHVQTQSKTSSLDSASRSLNTIPNDVEKNDKYLLLVKEKDILQDNYNKLCAELKQQQIVTEHVRQEASSFLEEMRTLAESTDLKYNNEKYVRKIEELKKEIEEWKQRYSKLKAKLHGYKSSSYSSFLHEKVAYTDGDKSLHSVDSAYLSDQGKINDTDVIKFQVSMEDFLVKARTSPTKNIMDHLHGVVSTTRVITQDINKIIQSEKLNADGPHLDGSKNSQDASLLRNDLAHASSMVSSTATHLITTTRNHSANNGISPLFLIDAAAADLSQAVVELVKLAKIKPTSDSGSINSPASGKPNRASRDKNIIKSPESVNMSQAKNLNGGDSYNNSEDQHAQQLQQPQKPKTSNRARSQSQSRPQFLQQAPSQVPPLPFTQDIHTVSGASHSGAQSNPSGFGPNDIPQNSNVPPSGALASQVPATQLAKETSFSQSQLNPPSSGFQEPDNGVSNYNSSGNGANIDPSDSMENMHATPPSALDYASYPSDAVPNNENAQGPHSYSQDQSYVNQQHQTFNTQQEQQPYQQQQQHPHSQQPEQFHQETAPLSQHSTNTPAPHGNDDAPNVSTVMIDPEKRTIQELQQYLETQTVAVINSIQSLLMSIKSGANYAKLRHDITTTLGCVRPFIDATSKSMTQSRNWRLKDLGQYLVDSLNSSCERMSSLYESSIQNEDTSIPDRHMKQRLASIAFDIAKSTKELVKTVEEVSINRDTNENDQLL